MAEILQSGTLSTAAGAVTYTVTDTTISLTYADGVTTSMPNISHDFDLSTNSISPTSNVLISGSTDQFHVNQNVTGLQTEYFHAQNLYNGTSGLRQGNDFGTTLAVNEWLNQNTSVDNVFSAIRDNPGPNAINEYNQQVEDYQVSLLLNRFPGGVLVNPANFGDFGNNPVYHRIFEDDHVLVNVTLPGHQFHGTDGLEGQIGRDADGGVVFRRAMELPDGSIQIVSIGLGTGPDQGWNNTLAPILWDVNGARVGENAGAYALNNNPPWFLLADETEAISALNTAIQSGETTLEEALAVISRIDGHQGAGNPYIKQELLSVIAKSESSCFGAGTPIDMWPLDTSLKLGPDGIYDQESVSAKIWKKPIELIEVGDTVVSFDDKGNMVPGYVPRTFQNEVKILLNFFGTRVTPGHVYYRADSKKAHKFETLIDILRDDGVIKHQDGTLIRAAINVPVDDPRDGFVQAITGTRKADGSMNQKDQGRIRLGTRFIVGEGKERKHWAVADLIEHAGGVVGEDEMIRVGDGPPMAFHWEFGDTLPKPEDFVLEASGTTLEDIYKAAEWESQQPQMPAPMVMDGGPVQPLPHKALNAMQRNEPLSFTPTSAAKPRQALNRKQRKAMEAKQRKAGKTKRMVS